MRPVAALRRSRARWTICHLLRSCGVPGCIICHSTLTVTRSGRARTRSSGETTRDRFVASPGLLEVDDVVYLLLHTALPNNVQTLKGAGRLCPPLAQRARHHQGLPGAGSQTLASLLVRYGFRGVGEGEALLKPSPLRFELPGHSACSAPASLDPRADPRRSRSLPTARLFRTYSASADVARPTMRVAGKRRDRRR
jgi:hypothetical protein